MRSLLVTWIAGAITGTLLIAITSPIFVRSYQPLQADSIRGVWTLAPSPSYRWRSEGYANTTIGPHGMPGRASLESSSKASDRIALWGDSQAEGVCVHDPDKLFAKCEQASSGSMAFLPFARSGEDAADWVTQIPSVEEAFQIDAHVILMTELSDLAAAIQAPVDPPSEADTAAARSAIAAHVPGFIIQGARHLLYEADNTTRRQWRFGLGRVESPKIPSRHPPDNPSESSPSLDRKPWREALNVLRQSSELPVILLYAPQLPQVVDGNLIREDPTADEFAIVQSFATELGIHVIDARETLIASADRGQWPHGFHNGQFGVGHLNARGNDILARLTVDVIQSIIE
ncbi:MAG: hypothetical protein AAGI63_02670 [Planctomycetota bacterium]